MKELIRKLDLEEFLKSYEGFLARPKELFWRVIAKHILKFISELEKIIFTPPKEVKNLDSALALLKKFGYLKLDEIFEFVKIIRYFNYLKTLKIEGILWDWIDGIRIPEAILEVAKSFGGKWRNQKRNLFGARFYYREFGGRKKRDFTAIKLYFKSK